MREKMVLSRDAYERLLGELSFLATTKRKELALRFKAAFEDEGFADGDIMSEEMRVEKRIRQINNALGQATMLEEPVTDEERIRIGSCFILRDLATREEIGCKLVSSIESDISRYMLSDESPVGKAIMGKCAGEIVRARVPQGHA